MITAAHGHGLELPGTLRAQQRTHVLRRIACNVIVNGNTNGNVGWQALHAWRTMGDTRWRSCSHATLSRKTLPVRACKRHTATT
jgi:hypothetical protein